LKENKYYEKESIESKMFLLDSSQIFNVVGTFTFLFPKREVLLKELDD
jgi:hypothetical protein